MAAADSTNEDLCLISKGLYRIVSDVIGPECLVKVRRQEFDIFETFFNCNPLMCITLYLLSSGSRAEGFHFQSADIDMMFVDRNVMVLNSYSYHLSNMPDFPILLLMETEDISPGFALLKCLKYDYTFKKIYNALVPRGSDCYVSSRLVREEFAKGEMETVHGPCTSGFTVYFDEYDLAYTLKCPYWPEQALPFIRRALHRGWPNRDVLLNICKDGCLFVPINSKQQTCSQLIDLEWRISFSLAEKKLVHSMNHSQFLCYGLMKVILNEILKKIPEIKELFCSYFMKTAVFWEISENRDDWSLLNFIFKFWRVFRRIVNWVAAGYCPNFFIPENNMFYGKVYGAPQRDLLAILRTLHGEGYRCLLRCVSFREKLSVFINNPQLSHFIPVYEEDYIPDHMIDTIKVWMIANCSVKFTIYLGNPIRALCNIIALIPLSEEMISVQNIVTKIYIKHIAFRFYSTPDMTYHVFTPNKNRYKYINTAQTLFRLAKPFLCSSEIKHASGAYVNGEYKKTIHIVCEVKQRLQRQPYMYEWNLDDRLIMECRLQGMLYEDIIKTFVISGSIFDVECPIEELCLERYQKGRSCLIPSLVFLNFVLLLAYTRLNEIHNRNEILSELQALLWYDDGHHIRSTFRAISWEILGICQQLCGDYHGAYQSYSNALNDKYNHFKPATISRIISLYPYMNY